MEHEKRDKKRNENIEDMIRKRSKEERENKTY